MSLNKIGFVLAALCLGVCLAQEDFSCYVCYSQFNGTCGDPATNTSLFSFKTKCASLSPQSQPIPELGQLTKAADEKFGCVKISFRNETTGIDWIARTCSIIKPTIDDSCDFTRENTNFTVKECNSCTTDLCNAAYQLSISHGTIFGFILALVFACVIDF